MFFGTSGDLDHLYRVADATGWNRTTIATEDLVRAELTVGYVAFELSRPVR